MQVISGKNSLPMFLELYAVVLSFWTFTFLELPQKDKSLAFKLQR